MDPNLVRAPGERHSLDGLEFCLASRATARNSKPGFCQLAGCTACIAVADTDELRLRCELALFRFAISEQQVFLPHGAPRELFRERAIRERRLAEDHHAAGFLVEPVNDG